ncbi:hypothetical protein BDK51DRAFT_39285 [Blyttiomyces helicus]|uniref:Uncharacterized protein n=1 Tax=Blyttiomyces helicus TaxID=388810 RepID=A0A4P9W3F9_9FUNG|nr:hypothetical protein BDK51DRAFT_39285 [Blyttiomyces helicus]|eukprot:RKO86664.1 hypothetical protein BDK51DRAFT_39285 [Blyttiomyces helicus]
MKLAFLILAVAAVASVPALAGTVGTSPHAPLITASPAACVRRGYTGPVLGVSDIPDGGGGTDGNTNHVVPEFSNGKNYNPQEDNPGFGYGFGGGEGPGPAEGNRRRVDPDDCL